MALDAGVQESPQIGGSEAVSCSPSKENSGVWELWDTSSAEWGGARACGWDSPPGCLNPALLCPLPWEVVG